MRNQPPAELYESIRRLNEMILGYLNEGNIWQAYATACDLAKDSGALLNVISREIDRQAQENLKRNSA